ncbi:AIM24 family protein [Prauserella cavernicola]|uniref:AIM24 family protein n=1 Tax=Prauserella cavernicola TaxID=2800127 RepID=A0A934QSD8_9PSEU|nr:AIM24 family protein [Prauserella cavernicola]MBK1785343.1 AIM24 family protein [Prauserella cavernicola]
MQVHTRHTPSFGVARIVLSQGEAVQAESDSVLANSFGIVESAPSRGKGPAIFTAPAGGGWIDLAPEHSGDIYPLEFDGRAGWCVATGRVLARPPTVRRDQPWPALQALFGGDSGFLEHFGGTGQLVLACKGPVDALTLEANEVITVRPTFLVAYPDRVQVRLRALDPAAQQSVRTGEGLALDFAGPGTVLVQARK